MVQVLPRGKLLLISLAALLPGCMGVLPDPPDTLGLVGDWAGWLRFERGPNDLTQHAEVPLGLPVNATWFVRTNALLLAVDATGDDYGDCGASATSLLAETNPAPLIVSFIDCWPRECDEEPPCADAGEVVTTLRLVGDVSWQMERIDGVANPVATFSGALLGDYEWTGACGCEPEDYAVPALGAFELIRQAGATEY